MQVYDPQVKREQMFVEFDYTCGVNKDNTPRLEDSVRQMCVGLCLPARLTYAWRDAALCAFSPMYSVRQFLLNFFAMVTATTYRGTGGV